MREAVPVAGGAPNFIAARQGIRALLRESRALIQAI
jgi:hypothetical protein